MIAIGSVFQLLNGLWFSDDGVEDSLVNSPLLIFCLIAFVAIFTNMVGHVLFIERTIATIYAGSYETNGKCLLFNIAWISILVPLNFSLKTRAFLIKFRVSCLCSTASPSTPFILQMAPQFIQKSTYYLYLFMISPFCP